MVELGVAMAMARDEVVSLLSGLIDDTQAHSVFPAATVRLEGFLEDQALALGQRQGNCLCRTAPIRARARCGGRADAHRAAPLGPDRASPGEGHARSTLLDRRAEGAPDRDRAGTCAAGAGHDRGTRQSCCSTRLRPILTRAAARRCFDLIEGARLPGLHDRHGCRDVLKPGIARPDLHRGGWPGDAIPGE